MIAQIAFIELPDDLCERCQERERRLEGQRWCRACQAAYMRANRRPYAELADDQKRRANCRAYTKTMQQRGYLPKGPCEGCGDLKAENHHWDYSKPRWFVRLCRSCHRALHYGHSHVKKNDVSRGA